MDRIVRGIDRPRGIVAFVVVVTLIAGFMVTYGGTLAGEGPEQVGYFVLFVVAVVSAAVALLVGWERHRERIPGADQVERDGS